MGKIKSAIITALLSAAIAVLAVFALFSWQVPGSNGVKRYNSFISSIHLGSDMTGNATAVLYPDGVISAVEYEGHGDKDDYVQYGSVYINKEVIEEYGEDGLKSTVAKDAKVLSQRLDEKGYAGYSVAVCDDYTVSVSVPTGFTYAEYKKYNESSRSEATSVIARTIQSLSYNGGLSLRNSEVGKTQSNNILTKLTDDVNEFFKSISKYSVGGNHSVRLNLTKEGREQFKSISAKVLNAESDKAIGFYVGDNQLLSLNISEEFDTSSFLITVSTSTAELDAQNYAIVLNSVVNGKMITLDYNSDETQIIYAGAELGDTAGLFLGVAMLLLVAGAIAYSIVRYKRLGLVASLIIVIYSLALITALMLLNIQLTLAGAITAILGLALLCGSSFATFEAVRKETLKGKTISSSVKEGYKTQLFGILEMHIIILIVSIFLSFVGVGAVSSCGLILFIATVASYVLYWFTRFMWFVTSALAKDKFKFCGYKREELEDD